MITPEEINRACARIKAAIEPPANPLGLESRTPSGLIPQFPKDLLAVVDMYGSGFFDLDGRIFLSIINPYEPQYAAQLDANQEAIRQLKDIEGDSYIPYQIFPEQPGLLLWAYGQQRKHFFWLTEGRPENWPVIVLHDLEIFTRFDMPMSRFLEQLLCGELECSFMGVIGTPDNKINPSALQFVPRVMP